MPYGYMADPNQIDKKISVPKGQNIAGNAIGILVLDLWYPYLPGNVANATTFNFPVLYRVLKGVSTQILDGDPSILDIIVEGARELQMQGARAVVGSCGYFGYYQKAASEKVNIPIFLSSLLQIPLIKKSLMSEQKVGVMCAVAPSLTDKLLSQCGDIDPADIVVIGAQAQPEFRNILESRGSFNSHKIEQELVMLATELVTKHPEVGAILLECSDMPPYASAIQDATRRPVFDFTTLINWVYSATVRRPFTGFV